MGDAADTTVGLEASVLSAEKTSGALCLYAALGGAISLAFSSEIGAYEAGDAVEKARGLEASKLPADTTIGPLYLYAASGEISLAFSSEIGTAARAGYRFQALRAGANGDVDFKIGTAVSRDLGMYADESEIGTSDDFR